MSSTSQPQGNISQVDTDLSRNLMSAASPASPRGTAEAERAMGSAAAWKPALDRRQSWNRQEHKHELQMSKVGDVKEGPGFSERSS